MSKWKRRYVMAFLVGALSMSLGVASADPSFGPGNADGGPHDAQSKCHPPGQETDTPGCK